MPLAQDLAFVREAGLFLNAKPVVRAMGIELYAVRRPADLDSHALFYARGTSMEEAASAIAGQIRRFLSAGGVINAPDSPPVPTPAPPKAVTQSKVRKPKPKHHK